MKRVLILAEEQDDHAQYVAAILKQKNIGVFFYDYKQYPFLSSVAYKLGKDQESLYLKSNKLQLDFKNITAIWYRRPYGYNGRSRQHNYIKEYIESESDTFLASLYGLTSNIYWFPSEIQSRSASLKPIQLKMAREAGLRIPETLIGNDIESATLFLQEHPELALKALGFGFVGIRDNLFQRFAMKLQSLIKKDSPKKSKQLLMFTKLLKATNLESTIHEIANCPVILQSYIPKRLELRITIVGRRIFPCAIYSQAHPQSRYDFRNLQDYDKVLEHKRFDLPDEVSQKILLFMEKMNLDFGCMDMIVTPDEEYVFLENNSNGQWLWVEKQTGYPIGEAIAEKLACR